jgi:hypothetical protein
MKETSRSEANLKLQPQEVELVGTWLQEHGKVRGDISCQRIKWLTENHLHKLKVAGGGWETLFQDPDDKRYWEQTYPQGEMQGGGPPKLQAITDQQAKMKYQV